MSSQKRLWNDTARYENALDQAVRFVARLSTLAREVVKQADEAVEEIIVLLQYRKKSHN